MNSLVMTTEPGSIHISFVSSKTGRRLSVLAYRVDSNLFGIGIFRKRLFQMINDLPTIFEVVTGNVKQPKDQSGPPNNSTKSKSSGKTVNCPFTLQVLFLHIFNYI